MRRRITVINPNTTASLTASIRAAARAAVDASTEVLAATNAHGPASIESHYDEALAVPGLLAAVAGPRPTGSTALSSPASATRAGRGARARLGPGRRARRGGLLPLVTMLGRSFSVVTTLARTMGQAEHLVQRRGLPARCRSIYACEVPVLALVDATGCAPPRAASTRRPCPRTSAGPDQPGQRALGRAPSA